MEKNIHFWCRNNDGLFTLSETLASCEHTKKKAEKLVNFYADFIRYVMVISYKGNKNAFFMF